MNLNYENRKTNNKAELLLTWSQRRSTRYCNKWHFYEICTYLPPFNFFLSIIISQGIKHGFLNSAIWNSCVTRNYPKYNISRYLYICITSEELAWIFLLCITTVIFSLIIVCFESDKFNISAIRLTWISLLLKYLNTYTETKAQQKLQYSN